MINKEIQRKAGLHISMARAGRCHPLSFASG